MLEGLPSHLQILVLRPRHLLGHLRIHLLLMLHHHLLVFPGLISQGLLHGRLKDAVGVIHFLQSLLQGMQVHQNVVFRSVPGGDDWGRRRTTLLLPLCLPGLNSWTSSRRLWSLHRSIIIKERSRRHNISWVNEDVDINIRQSEMCSGQGGLASTKSSDFVIAEVHSIILLLFVVDGLLLHLRRRGRSLLLPPR